MSELRDRVRRFLDGRTTMTLACADEEGPWAADVYFVRHGPHVYFLSSPGSRHARALAADPRVAATVHADTLEWREIRGVQASGTVAIVEGRGERAAAMAAYLERYGFAKDLLAAGLAEKVELYRLTPERLLFVDNSRGFGHRDEVSWFE